MDASLALGSADGQAEAVPSSVTEFAAILSGLLGAAQPVKPVPPKTAAPVVMPAGTESAESPADELGDAAPMDIAAEAAATDESVGPAMAAAMLLSSLLAALPKPSVVAAEPDKAAKPTPTPVVPSSARPPSGTESGAVVPSAIPVGRSLLAELTALPAAVVQGRATLPTPSDGPVVQGDRPRGQASDIAATVMTDPPTIPVTVQAVGSTDRVRAAAATAAVGSDSATRLVVAVPRDAMPKSSPVREDSDASAAPDRVSLPAGIGMEGSGSPRSPAGSTPVTAAPRPVAPDVPIPTADPHLVTVSFSGADGVESRIRVSVMGDSVRATILTDAHSAPQLERALPELQRSLIDRGFSDARVVVRVVADGAGVAMARSESTSTDQGRSRGGESSPHERSRDFAGQDRPRGRDHHPGEEAQP